MNPPRGDEGDAPGAPGQSIRKNLLEWSVFALSLVLVLTITGYLAYHALQQPSESPAFDFHFGVPEQQDSLFVLPVVVHNTGNQTAADVLVTVTSGAEETEVVFDYVPRHSTREGAALFRALPEAPTAHVTSYSLP